MNEDPPPESALSSIATELLLARFQEGEPRAMDELFFRVRGRLRAAIRNHPGYPFLPATHDIEDSLQDLWLALFARGSLDRFENRGSGSLRAYLHRCLDFIILDTNRKGDAAKRGGDIPHQPIELEGSTSGGPIPIAVGGPGPATAVEWNDWESRCLRLLDGQDREVWKLRFVEDLEYADIAARLGITTTAVRSAYFRACRKLYESGILKVA